MIIGNIFSTVTGAKKTGHGTYCIFILSINAFTFHPSANRIAVKTDLLRASKDNARCTAKAQKHTCHCQPPCQNQDPIFHLYHLDLHLSNEKRQVILSFNRELSSFNDGK